MSSFDHLLPVARHKLAYFLNFYTLTVQQTGLSWVAFMNHNLFCGDFIWW